MRSFRSLCKQKTIFREWQIQHLWTTFPNMMLYIITVPLWICNLLSKDFIKVTCSIFNLYSTFQLLFAILHQFPICLIKRQKKSKKVYVFSSGALEGSKKLEGIVEAPFKWTHCACGIQEELCLLEKERRALLVAQRVYVRCTRSTLCHALGQCSVPFGSSLTRLCIAFAFLPGTCE